MKRDAHLEKKCSKSKPRTKLQQEHIKFKVPITSKFFIFSSDSIQDPMNYLLRKKIDLDKIHFYKVWKRSNLLPLWSTIRTSLPLPVADPDLELREGGCFDLLALLAFLPSVISSFFSENKGKGGGSRAPGPLDPPLLSGTQIMQSDFQNKGESGWTGKSSFGLDLRSSKIYSVQCDRIVQRAYLETNWPNI